MKVKTINEENYVDFAEAAIIRLKKSRGEFNQRTKKKIQIVTTSKIRNLLSMSADIYNSVIALKEDKMDPKLAGRVEYLRMRFIYECGREPEMVEPFVHEAKILEIMKEINKSRENYILFNHYMEALVAFRKFHCGKDD